MLRECDDFGALFLHARQQPLHELSVELAGAELGIRKDAPVQAGS